MSDIVTRKVTLNELPILQAISRQTFLETFADQNSEEDMQAYLESSFSADKLDQELKNISSVFYFALMDNKVIGYLKMNFAQAQTELQNERSMEIERIYVLREFQGRKAGHLLFETALEIARRARMEFIWLGVWEKNYSAIKFYSKKGFVEFDRHIFKLGNDEQIDIMMRLTL
jgi:diamine N-acetyltransferase